MSTRTQIRDFNEDLVMHSNKAADLIISIEAAEADVRKMKHELAVRETNIRHLIKHIADLEADNA